MSTTKHIPTPAENEIRPRYEAVRSRHSKAVEELEAARQAEATAQDNVNAHLALADTKESKPKSWAHDLGLPHDQVTVAVSGREAHGRVHDRLVFDGGQSAQTGLPAASVVGPLDPGDDRDPELFSGPPPFAVQDVLLQQREKGFHRGVIAGSADLAHRSDEVVTVQGVHEFS